MAVTGVGGGVVQMRHTEREKENALRQFARRHVAGQAIHIGTLRPHTRIIIKSIYAAVAMVRTDFNRTVRTSPATGARLLRERIILHSQASRLGVHACVLVMALYMRNTHTHANVSKSTS